MVATCGGALLGLAPIVGPIGAVVWIVVFALARYASVARSLAALSLPIAALLLDEPWPVLVFTSAAALGCSSCIAATSRVCGRAPRPASSCAASPPRP